MKKITFSIIFSAILIAATAESAFAQTSIRIYNAYLNPAVPLAAKGILAMKDGKKKPLVATPAVHAAHKTLSLTSSFFANQFGRLSFDGQNSTIEASVNVQKVRIFDFMGLSQNAAWINTKKMFIFGGGGKLLDNFEKAIDVVAHEYTHAVIDSSSQLKYEGQSGALNESFADIFGVIVENQTGNATPGREYMIGDTILSDSLKNEIWNRDRRTVIALRDMLRPAQGLESQPDHISKIPYDLQPGCIPSNSNDLCGVHLLSGIPNKAAALIMSSLGIASTQKLFYVVMTQRLHSSANFSDFSLALRNECRLQLSQSQCDIVDESLIQVGI